MTEFDVKTTVPKHLCTKQSQRDCSHDAYSVFIANDVLTQPGTYFIGVQYDKGNGVTTIRQKRSCSGGRRQKRSCVEPKDPPRPENITVKPTYNPRTDVNYSMSILEDGCLHWDSVQEEWSSKGCRVSSL